MTTYDNGFPPTPEWSLPPRVPVLPAVTIATAEIDPRGSE